MLHSELREATRRGFLEFAWRQWAQLGLSANITRLDPWAIDPEALILFTIEIARRDPRLFDEVMDWLAVNRGMLTTQRLRNLAARFPVDYFLAGAVIASAEDGGSTSLWPAKRRGQPRPDQPVLVFNPEVLSFVGEPDPIFASFGYVRPRIIRSGKSGEPDVAIAANLAFKLRHLLGPGGRSEVIRILLTFSDGPLDAARISDEAGFAKRNVSDTLASLTASRVVKARWSGNERHYLAYRDKWATLLEVGPSAKYLPSFVSWVHLFPAALEIISWLEDEARNTESEYLFASQARDLIERIAQDLEIAGISPVTSRPLPGAAYMSNFEDIVYFLLAKMGVEE